MRKNAARIGMLVLVVAAVVAAAVGTARADVAQTPVKTGCPTGFDRLSVTALEAQGPYALPRKVDSAGNDNGYVCGNAQPDAVRDAYCRQGASLACQLQALGLPHYVFRDDDSPAYTP